MSDLRTIRVAMAGCGTVGSGVAELVIDRGAELAARTGVRFQIVRALVSDVSKTRYVALDPAVFTADLTAFNATDADMVVEVLGGTGAARDVVLAALARGLPVVTANKALLARHGEEVFRTARAGGACVAFESSCAGGLPIIGALLHGLQANRIDRIYGIFNSTCNFVLTQMLDHGISFADAVAEAQRHGYAEADPTLDVDGTDTAHKLTILASLAFGLNIQLDRIDTEGIQNVQLLDLQIARRLGFACKLLGTGRRIYPATFEDDEPIRPEQASRKVFLAVQPTLVPASSPFAGMTGTCSGVSVDGDALGNTLYTGAGAGSLPTASGVVADMIDVATGAAQAAFANLRIFNDQTPAAEYVSAKQAVSACYVRFNVDAAGASSAALERAWRRTPVALSRFETLDSQGAAALITEPVARDRLRAALQVVAGSLHLTAQPVVLPVLCE